MTEPTIVLSDRELADVNRLLPWLQSQQDASGRILGYFGQRRFPLIEGRVKMLAERFDLAGKRVLEPGCLDGTLTVGLCAYGADVTSFDARPSCAAKTFTRCLSFGFHPRVMLHDARRMSALGAYDAIFHAGVFYHLVDPVSHLRSISDMAPVILLDTHTAHPEREICRVDGYDGTWYQECGWGDEQSGVDEKSLWLTRESLFRLFGECGFECEVIQDADGWENGPRGQYLLRKQ